MSVKSCARCGQPIDHPWATTSYCRACHAAARRASAQNRRREPAPRVRRIYSAPGVLTKAEAARRLGLSRDRVGRLANAGCLDLHENAVAAEARRREQRGS